ncbi:MAG TPA: hypothetical protein PL029_10455, partial [Bacteroidia bacterium]|nr:hypothetical protein [Bacteroidia bacterium]
MFKSVLFLSLLWLLLISKVIVGQNDSKKWYFGNQAGLDFMTNPPTILTNGAMTNLEGCASIADPTTGNLLFYTNGIN